ncbi:MAG: hypothetical protein MR893_01590, partial [Prevotellaceae bacterium]|nr:hypothetical protein [Prevotellaceae bacterium]
MSSSRTHVFFILSPLISHPSSLTPHPLASPSSLAPAGFPCCPHPLLPPPLRQQVFPAALTPSSLLLPCTSRFPLLPS